MRPFVLAAAFGLFALPAAAQSTPEQATQPTVAAVPEATTAATDPSTATPTPRINMTRTRSDKSGYSGCSYSTASPVS